MEKSQPLAGSEPQESLSQAAERVNYGATGVTAHEIHAKAAQHPLLGREVAEVAADVIERADELPTRHVYYHGLTDMLAAFKEESVGALQAVRLLEEHTFLDGILSEALGPNIGGVRVVIAGEGRWEELSHCSMVPSRYGVSDQATAALGALARRLGCYVAAAAWERDDDWPDRFFNGACIIGPGGDVELRYRKLNEGNFHAGVTGTTPADVLDEYERRLGPDALFPVCLLSTSTSPRDS